MEYDKRLREAPSVKRMLFKGEGKSINITHNATTMKFNIMSFFGYSVPGFLLFFFFF